MAEYLDVPKGDDVSVVKNFPPERIFNLVGTNPRDYTVAGGISAWAAGDASDGLVRIENATTHGPGPDGKDVTSPRAFVHRSHSGHYGIVNSEEGYQNLTRFLFGALRVDGILDIDDITLPVEVQKAHDDGKTVRASYQFEIAVSVRGCQWQMTRREVRENSAIFRTYDELFPGKDGTKRVPDRSQEPAPVLRVPRSEQERQDLEVGQLRVRPQGARARLRSGRLHVHEPPLRGRLHPARADPGGGVLRRSGTRAVGASSTAFRTSTPASRALMR